ncbi:hypothetical protein J5N97_028111 [Dioscorea zingiberensis]|uniref:6-phosphogluconate dehydrogenase NADP-binding domain-containing protein n=1 Tax=Dioscorea zingiberensis TaxID=325984 RepID=A0A9D5H4K8_9LILI|nr:hypothetical protein J5N97_028111 [Dioscorea zingiberensis]
MESAVLSLIVLAALVVMGQNLADKVFPISVYNNNASMVNEAVSRTTDEGSLPLFGHHSPHDFVLSIARPSFIIILIKASALVDQIISALSHFLETEDSINNGGNDDTSTPSAASLNLSPAASPTLALVSLVLKTIPIIVPRSFAHARQFTPSLR